VNIGGLLICSCVSFQKNNKTFNEVIQIQQATTVVGVKDMTARWNEVRQRLSLEHARGAFIFC
jgi:hypothetical protein